MSKSIITLFLALLLSGCYQTVNDTDIMKAKIACQGAGGIEYISANFLGDEVASCKNGKGVMLSDKLWSEIK